jgi:sugar lactone lactonase YvrE
MQTFLRFFITAVATVGVVACGGGNSGGISAATSSATTSITSTSTSAITPNTTTPTTSLTYAFPLSGITFSLAVADSVNVPPGTTVQTANGSATISGSNSVLYTGAGATITVPANPGTAATNLISTAAPASGAAYLGPAVIVPLIGSATATSPVSDGQGTVAILEGNGRLAADPYGNVYSSDAGALKFVNGGGFLSTVVGTNSPYNWQSMAPDGASNVYGQGPSTSSPAGQAALSIHLRQQTGALFTVAENWTSTATPGANWGTTGIAVGSTGVLYAIDPVNHRVVRFFFSGTPQPMAGSGRAGFVDGSGAGASFNNPTDLTVDSRGNVYVADTGNHAVRKITNAGKVVTIALTGNPGPIAVDGSGNVYCMASVPATLVRISADLGVVTSTVLGGITGTVTGLAVVPDGGTIYIAARTHTGGAQIYRMTR